MGVGVSRNSRRLSKSASVRSRLTRRLLQVIVLVRSFCKSCVVDAALMFMLLKHEKHSSYCSETTTAIRKTFSSCH